MQSNMYLEDNLVGGQILRAERKSTSTQQSTDDSEKFITVENFEEDVKQIHQKVIFERNIAIFYFNLLRKIWNA